MSPRVNTRSLIVSVPFLAGLGLLAAGSPQGATRQVPCNPPTLGRAMMLDISKLDRDTVYTGARDEAMTHVEAFHDSATLRMLRVSRYGEQNDAVDVYYLTSEETYIVEHTETYYSAPYWVDDRRVVSRFKQFFYICGDELVDFHYNERAEHLKEELSDLLVAFAGKVGSRSGR